MKKVAVAALVYLKGIVSFLANGGFSNGKCGEWMLALTLNGSVKLIGCLHL
jgi:hypothetical protein